jgi:hypothetical protein
MVGLGSTVEVRSVDRVPRRRAALADELVVRVIFDVFASFPTLLPTERAFSEPEKAVTILISEGLSLTEGISFVVTPTQVHRDSVLEVVPAEDTGILVGEAIGGVAVIAVVACAVGCAVVKCRKRKRRIRIAQGERLPEETAGKTGAVATLGVGWRGKSLRVEL